MPFPAARKPLQHVGSTGRKGSYVATCSNAKISCTIRSCQFAQRTVCDAIFSQIRRNHFWRLSKKATPTPVSESTIGLDSGQRSLSPCQDPAAISCRQESHSFTLLSPTIQSRIESGGKSLETYKKDVHSQSILPTTQRSDRGRNRPNGDVAKTQPYTSPFMRHYLSRCV
jgi:hypothetical protein